MHNYIYMHSYIYIYIYKYAFCTAPLSQAVHRLNPVADTGLALGIGMVARWFRWRVVKRDDHGKCNNNNHLEVWTGLDTNRLKNWLGLALVASFLDTRPSSL